jgi:hypothetical protein
MKCNYCNKEHENNNTGCKNSGNYNSGNCNSGNRNSGHYNSGDNNSGHYNSGDNNSGLFNTNEPKMRFFNKDSDITYSEFCKNIIVYPDLKITSWVSYKDLPKDEQTTETKNMDGKLKTLTYKEAWKEYWGRASEEDKKWFQNLPNFSWDIFTEITGIEPEKPQEVSLSGKTVKVTIDGKDYEAVIK